MNREYSSSLFQQKIHMGWEEEEKNGQQKIGLGRNTGKSCESPSRITILETPKAVAYTAYMFLSSEKTWWKKDYSGSDRQDGVHILEVLFFHFISEQDFLNIDEIQGPNDDL